MADQFVKMLNSYGYVPVLLPRTGLVPPELYNFDNHKLIRLGALSDCIKNFVSFTPTSGNLADFEGKITSSKDIGASLKFLNNALSVIGLTSIPTFNFSFAGSDEFVFAFKNITFKSVDPLVIDKTLQALTLPLAIPQEYLEENNLHVAYEYAYSTAFTMSRSDHQQFKGDASIAIKDIIDLGPKVKVEVTRNTTITFTTKDGSVPAFAYKAGQLLKEDGHWTFKPEVVQKGFAGGPMTPVPFVPAYGVVLHADEVAIAAAR
jgi:hypothetical protein